jgi:3D (Asp-Asp-Asp) domain-containing protein
MKLLLLTALALALTTQGHAPKLRRFTVSAYCHCRVCTHRGDGITASGVRVREGITIAAPRSIPFGTRIWVPGAGWRTVQDRLSAAATTTASICTSHLTSEPFNGASKL